MVGQVELVAVGAGQRGTFTYGAYALEHCDDVRYVAVAEPDQQRRERFARRHNLPADRCFETWQQLTEAPKLAQGAVITTQDQLHVEPAIAMMNKGYDVLLEKPMAITPADCLRLVDVSESTSKMLMVCHVLRYTELFSKVHEIVTSGRLGEIITIEHRENLHCNHMAHSFVRGNWRNAEQSCPMILAKCCHDLDILVWMMSDHKVRRVQSIGSLVHFRPENAPPGATERCTDNCPAADTCIYYAPRYYLDPSAPGHNAALVSAISIDTSDEARLHALATGPYGRCVYKTDNNVVDHQVVNLEFNSGTIATLIMQGFSHEEGRTMRYDGTRATMRATFPSSTPPQLEIHDHLTGHKEEVLLGISPADSGHGGGDAGIMKAFVKAMRGGAAEVLSSARVSLTSHLLAFAAEEARLTGATVDMDVFTNHLLRDAST